MQVHVMHDRAEQLSVRLTSKLETLGNDFAAQEEVHAQRKRDNRFASCAVWLVASAATLQLPFVLETGHAAAIRRVAALGLVIGAVNCCHSGVDLNTIPADYARTLQDQREVIWQEIQNLDTTALIRQAEVETLPQ
jgi:hypothetical protein